MAGIAIYARKSTESEDRQILSIDSQIKELKEFARRERLVVASVLTESKSAKAPGRPVFNDLYARIQKGAYDGVICWKLDRLARNPVDGGALIWAMDERKLSAIHTPQRSFINTGNDKFFMQLEFGMAKKYVDDLSDNVKRGIRARLAQGWPPYLPPIGYLNNRNEHIVVRDPERFALVRRMWDLMLTGNHTPSAILSVATNKWKLRTRQLPRIGGKPLSLSVVYKLFRNPFYYGLIRCNGALHRGAHEPMVTKSEFDRVQALLSKSDSTRPQRHFSPFTGLMKCGECGASITAEHKISRYNHKYVYYRCTHNKPGVHCLQKVVSAKELERQILEYLDTITLSDHAADWAIKRVIELNNDEAEKDRSSVDSLNRRLASCKRELVELTNIRLKGLISDHEFSTKKNELENERVSTESLLTDASGAFSNLMERVIEFFEFAKSAKATFASGSPEQKRAALSLVGLNLVLKDRILSIEAPKPFVFIKTFLRSPAAKNATVEPQILDQGQPRKGRGGTRFSRWWALVNDVRTFFKENPETPSYHNVIQPIKNSRFKPYA